MSTGQSKLAAAFVILMGAAAFAQSNQGTITGTISDPGGAVIAAAQIEVRNTETSVVYRGGTSNTGNYVLALPSGIYEITVTVPGFKKFVQSNVQVVTASDTRKDMTLEVGSTNEQVTVTDTAPMLKTESGEMSHVVEIKDAVELPLLTISGGGFAGATAMGNIRNPLQTSVLLPGVSFVNDNQVVVNGLPSNSESIRIEGQDSTGTLWKVYQQRSQTMGVEAVQEVNVQTSNFAAEYGQAGGGYFNFTMKSGTNQYHGSAYDYIVNEAFNAGLPFTDAGTLTPLKAGQHIRNTQRRQDLGFTVGGPIRIPKLYNGTNRTFFFFNFEQYRESRQISNGLMSVPTAAYRSGDFSNSGCLNFNAATNQCNGANAAITTGAGAPVVDSAGRALTYGEVFDPTTTRVVNGATVRDPFANGQIPIARFDPVSLAIQKMLPQPNRPGIINNFAIPSYSNFTHTTNLSWKIDHSLSPTAKLSWYLSHYAWNSPNANGIDADFTGSVPTAYRNWTTRVNYDHSLRPTLLLHVGIGYLHQYEPTIPRPFDENSLGLHGYFDETLFPSIFNLGSPTTSPTGGWGCVSAAIPCGASALFANVNGVGGAFKTRLFEEKSTANASLTWVHGNHIFKYGGETTIEGYPNISSWRANGFFVFSNAETSDPWQNGQSLNFTNGTGFNYASFMLGFPDQLQLSPLNSTKLGNHSMGFYAQDTWKITRKLTLDLGLRYDFQTYLKEQYGRMQEVSWSTPNPTVGGLLGSGIYEGDGPGQCKCAFSHNYKFAFGPRVGVAYQINTKTVLRAGAGVMYGTTMTPQGLSYGVADYYTYNALGYGITPLPNGLQGGNPSPNLKFPDFSPGKYPVGAGGLLPPGNPNIYYAPSARPPRILQWSFGFQREVFKDLVAEATYVGNREVWGAAPFLDQISSNSLTPAILAAHGLSLSNAADRTLLTSPISSAQAAARGIFPAYPGMPPNSTVAQNLRPSPQFTAPTAVDLGPAIGKTWYDSLQLKATKRFSHGLSVQGSFVWAKGLALGTGAEAGNITTLQGIPIYNDIYNYGINKQLNQLVRPEAAVISGTYRTPKFAAGSMGMKALSQVVRDWQLGWVLRYQNGALIQTPYSNNQLNLQLARATPTNWNYVPGVSPLTVADPNCGCFNPQTSLVLNKNAWTDAPGGTFGVSAPFYSNYRWQRQPAESMSFGRKFRIGKEDRYSLFVDAEFQNIFNRHFLSMPLTGTASPALSANPSTPSTSAGGVYTGGYGYIPTIGGAGAVPRSGQIVARFIF